MQEFGVEDSPISGSASGVLVRNASHAFICGNSLKRPCQRGVREGYALLIADAEAML